MTDIEASLGIHQLRKLERNIELREKWSLLYDKMLSDIPEIILPYRAPGQRHAYHLYIIKLKLELFKVTRNKFMEMLKAENIGCGIHFVSVHIQPYYQKRFAFKREDYPNATWLSDRIISLPLFPQMTESDISSVVYALKKVIAHNRC
jgi:dTDP-4-amino-4,6-dideoxygalactose transaminase